ncbi:MAG TPA: hypothetical protein VIC58_07475 [Actinomycetota bacterium]|jgi:hypothetical protein
MSTWVESPPTRHRLAAGSLVVLLVALATVFVLIRTTAPASHVPQAAPAGFVGWDAGKLEAMEGRAMAETIRLQQEHGTIPALTPATPANAEAGSLLDRTPGTRH